MIDELAKELMLGSAKLPRVLPGMPEELKELLGSDPDEPHEQRALQLAAVLTAYEQAGLEPTQTEGPAAPQSRKDESPACSDAAAEVLNRIITTENDLLLKEWVTLATGRKRRAPHKCLVGLLTRAKNLDDLRPQILEVIDNRGRWLAKVNSDWDYVFQGMPSDVPDERVWLEGSFKERLQYLRTLRHAGSGQVLHLLTEGLEGENAKTRTAFIQVLDEGLSKADHDFLESMLDDRSIEVRRTAARMLCRIPGSDLSKRMATRLQPLVKVGGKVKRLLGRKTVTIEPPEELDDAMKRDGLSAKTGSGMGRRAWLLSQVCAHTPLAWWEKSFPFSVSDWMARATKNDWKVPLFSGWITAAIEQKNQTWILELLKTKLPKQLAELSRGLVGALSVKNRLHWYATQIDKGNFLSVYYEIIEARRAESALDEDEKLSRAILTRVRRQLGTKKARADYRLRNSLPKLALILSPKVLSEALDNWPTETPSFESYAEHAAEFFERIKLRQQMHEEFK